MRGGRSSALPLLKDWPQRHRDTELKTGRESGRESGVEAINQLTERIIGCAIEVHKALGPGLLEAMYEEALCIELTDAGLSFRR